ncbi:MAG TPA: hypothetical protein VKY85_05845 [Candidatus Angelobacter sp.]|nr:hypothetical protein [Candidatus Angelobacter sp.]
MRDMDVAADGLDVVLGARFDFSPGDKVTAELGYADRGLEEVFTGEVVEIASTLQGTQVRSLGKMNALLTLKVAKEYEERDAGEIARDLISQAGLTAGTVDRGPTLPRFTIDQRQSAYQYLRNLADRLGYELYANRKGDIMFREMTRANNLSSSQPGGPVPNSETQYVYGESLLQLVAQSLLAEPSMVEVGGESPTSRTGEKTFYWLTTQESDVRDTAGSGRLLQSVLDPAARTKDLAKIFATGLRTTWMRRRQLENITVLGNAEIDLGDSVSVTGVPEKSANTCGYVKAIRHRFGAGVGFLTDLCFVPEGTA